MASTSIALFVLLCVVVPGALSISFNMTLNDECVFPMGCSFFNAAIWEGGVVPSANDEVNITGTWDGNMATFDKVLYIYVDEDSVVSLKRLFVHAAGLQLRPNTTLSVNGTSYFNTNSSLYVNETAAFTTVSLTVVSDAWLFVHGAASAVNATLVGGLRLGNAFQVENLIFGSHNYSLAGFTGTNSITVQPYVTLNVPVELQVNTIIAQPNATVNLLSTVTVTKIQIAENAFVVASGIATIGTNSTNALSGSGSLYLLSTASITAAVKSAPFNGTIYVGDVVVSLYGVSLFNMVFSEKTTVYAGAVTFTGPVTVMGTFVVLNSSLVVSELTLLGSLSVEYSDLTVATSLHITENSTFVLENSRLYLSGVVTGHVVIPATSTLTSTSKSATVRGRFENHASISLSATNPLNVVGDAILHNTSKISATVSKDAVVLFVNGTLSVAGQLAYIIAKKPILNSNTYLVAKTVNGNVTGTFNEGLAAKADAGSQITRDLPITYASDSVSIKYQWSLKDTQWWIWLILGVGVTVLIGVVGIIVRIKVRRAKYSPVR